MRGQCFLYYLVKFHLHGGILFLYLKNEWIVFPWENALNLQSDRKEYLNKRGLSWKKIIFSKLYGFSKQTKKLLREFINIFNDFNIAAEPFDRQKTLFKRKYMGIWTSRRNFHDLKKCDCIFAIVNGTPPDEGVMIELGIAIALKKKIFLFRDDFRKCSDSNQYPLNLMLFLDFKG